MAGLFLGRMGRHDFFDGHGPPRQIAPRAFLSAADQRLQKVQARGETLFGAFGQGAAKYRPVLRRQRRQVRLGRQVQHHQLIHVLAPERHRAGEQLLIDDGQAVLIAMTADGPAQQFRRRVQRRHAALPMRGMAAVHLAEPIHQAEVGHLQVIADQKQVVRFDVEMLQAVAEVHPVQRLGRFQQVAQQLFARDARLVLALVIAQQAVQALVGQLHDDDENAVHDLDAVQRQDEGMADGFDQLQGFAFLVGRSVLLVLVGHELDGLVQAAGRLALPDFAEAAATQRFDQAITGDRLGARFAGPGRQFRGNGDCLLHGIYLCQGTGGERQRLARTSFSFLQHPKVSSQDERGPIRVRE